MRKILSILLVLASCTVSNANDYFNASGVPAAGAALNSAAIRSEYASIEGGFNKLPAMFGKSNLPVFVNAATSALEAKSIIDAQTLLGFPVTSGNNGLPIFVNSGGTGTEAKSVAAAKTVLGLDAVDNTHDAAKSVATAAACSGNSATATLASTVTTNANLTGEVTSSGNAATLTNSAVIGKVLTGYSSGSGTVSASDTILQAIQKLNGNDAAFVKMDQTSGQTIGTTGARLTKLWATDANITNTITGSVTGNAATVTTNANLTGPITSSGNATAIASQTGTGTKFVMDTSPTIATPTVSGNSGFGGQTSGSSVASIDNAGFTRLGDSSAPIIKTKKLTGITEANAGAATAIAHGLTASKIISLTAMVDDGTGVYYPPNVAGLSNHEYAVYAQTTYVYVVTRSSNAASILSKPFTVYITYEQ